MKKDRFVQPVHEEIVLVYTLQLMEVAAATVRHHMVAMAVQTPLGFMKYLTSAKHRSRPSMRSSHFLGPSNRGATKA